MGSNKTLLIVESPNKIKTIQKYLGPDYIIRASYGHLVDLGTGEDHNTGIAIAQGFLPKYQIIPEKKAKLDLLIKDAKNVELILLASDPDREGEAISWHLNEALSDLNIPIKRVTFRELTKKPILEAIENPRELDTDLFLAQQARRVLDRLVGFLVSGYLGNHLRSSLSAGRVQSVAVRVVVDREREIEAFKPEEYFNLLATVKNTKGEFVARNADKLTTKVAAQELQEAVKNNPLIVASVEPKEKQIKAFPPFITSTLVGAASGVLKFPAAKTMQIAQKLYEAGLITYMRTDSPRAAPEAIAACRDYLSTYFPHALPDKPNQFKTKDTAQDAHEAIRPTNVKLTSDDCFLEQEAIDVYKLIWEQFVASQMTPAIFDTISATITAGNKILKATGKTLRQAGWQELVKDGQEDKLPKLPELVIGEELKLIKTKIEKKATQPPPRYTEKSLIAELEKKEIGRPSTYATILTKITDKQYVGKKGENYIATVLGKKIIDELTQFFSFMNYKYTAEMEKQLDLVSEGKLEYQEMLTNFYKDFSEQLKNAHAFHEKDYGYTCNKCERYLQLRKSDKGYYLICFSCRVRMQCDIVDQKIVIKQPDPHPGVNCPICNDGMTKIYGKYSAFYACVRYPLCDGRKQDWEVMAANFQEKEIIREQKSKL